LVHPSGQMLRGNLPDPDDYMYLNQVLDWVKGQSWHDTVQHRLDPPGGGPIHFSRLAQIPIAGFILLFQALGFNETGAAMLAAILEPLFLLAGFLLVIRWTARSLMPKDWSGVTAYIVLFATGLLGMYAPGHVDHHGQILLLLAAALGCAFRMMQKADELRWGLCAGFLMALALTMALEVLPWIIVLSGWTGLWAMAKGGPASRQGLAYGLALFLAGAALLLTARAPALLLAPDVIVYSIVYVFFTGSIAAVFAGIVLAGNSLLLRGTLGAGTAAATGTLFFMNYPALLGGPWAGVDPALARLILDNVTEAAPLYKLYHSWLKAAVVASGPLIALAANLYFFKKASAERRWPWSLNAILMTAALLLTIFYQYRFVAALGLFMIVPMAVLLQRGLAWIGDRMAGRPKVFAEIALLLLVGPLPAVLLPAAVDGRSFNTGVLLFAARHGAYSACDMYGLEKALKSPQLYGGRPRIIMNTMGLGPELMFRTPHKVMSAPYHEDVAGNLDAVRFFSATDPARAEDIARRRNVDLVVACKVVPGMYTNLATIREVLPDTANNIDKMGVNASPPFLLRLISGYEIPSWLRRVHSPLLKNYVVYQVAPPPRETSPAKTE
ncbi:MAG: hypothetical protein AB7H77_11525, partial [Bdellovibrionales bacterium]